MTAGLSPPPGKPMHLSGTAVIKEVSDLFPKHFCAPLLTESPVSESPAGDLANPLDAGVRYPRCAVP